METLPKLPPQPAPEEEMAASAQIPALEPYLAQLALSKAAELARRGNFQEAEELIAGLGSGKEQPAALDLLARIRAQQGRWLEAEAFWKQALQQDPTNPAYLEGLQYIQRSRRGPALGRIFSTIFFMVLVGTFVLLAILGVQRLSGLNREIQDATSQVGALQDALSQSQATVIAEVGSSLPTQVIPTFPVEDLANLHQEVQDSNTLTQAGLENLQQQVEDLQTSQADLLTSLQPTPTAELELTLSVPGTQLNAQDEGWTVHFEEGLFPYGWALSQPGRQTLDALSQQLKPYMDKIDVSIVGFKSSDEQDEYFDLGLMRSVVVLDYLEKNSQLPVDMFKIQPQGSLPSPFPDDSLANQERNRSVILIIRPKAP